MGNESSSERKNESVTSPSKDAYQASTTNISPAATRRIVKAVKPTPPSGGPETSHPEENDHVRDDDDDNEDSKQRNRWSHSRDVPIPPHESPSIAREVELEKLNKQKQERLETMQTNQRLRREKRLDDRRKRNPQDGSGGDDSETTSHQVQANPFSKFLSVFSVEPKYPEHKRSYEVSEDDEPEPSVKKARASLDNNDSIGRPPLLLTGVVAVAVLAIGVGVFLRAKRSKI